MKKFGLGALVLSMVLISCPMGIVSPTIAFVEVLDSNENTLRDVSFTVTLDGKEISDLYVEIYELSEDELDNFQKYNDTSNFFNGSYYYEVCSINISDSITYDGENYEDLLSRIEITVSKDGYTSEKFMPSKTDTSNICYKSITLNAST